MLPATNTEMQNYQYRCLAWRQYLHPGCVREYPRNTLSCDMNECEDEYERCFASRCFFLLRRLAKVLRLLPIVELSTDCSRGDGGAWGVNGDALVGARAEVAEVVKVWDKIASLDRFETEEEAMAEEDWNNGGRGNRRKLCRRRLLVKAAGRGCQSIPWASAPHHPINPIRGFRSGLTNPILIRLNKLVLDWD